MDQTPIVDVSAILDRQRIGSMQITVLLICMLAMTIDGYDVFVVGYVLPAIAQDFKVEPAMITPVLMIQQIGLAVGSFLVSPIADRVGRRTVLIVCALMFGLFTLATTQAHSIGALAALRFCGGIFMSAVVPNTIALTSEIAPARHRATLITIMFCGYTFGSAAGGWAATLLLGRFGWQSAFWAGGLLPLVLLPVLALVLPESLGFRVQRNPRDPSIGHFLRRLEPGIRLTGSERFELHEATVSGTPVAALFRDGRAAATLLLWCSFFMSLLAISLATAWMPTFFRTLGGMSLQRAAGISVLMAAAGIGSMLFYGIILDRFGASRVLTISYVLGALAVAAIGILDWNSWLFYGAIVVEGACVIGGQSGLNALTATLYPTRMRATGVGWAFGLGRLGSILGPGVGGFMLAQHWSAGPVFLIAAVPIFLVAVGTFLVDFGVAPEPKHPVPAPAGAE